MVIREAADLANAVRAARRRHKLRQADLAGLSGTGLRFISELERGKSTVALNKVIDVLNVLGLCIHVTSSQELAESRGGLE
ncbi:type II toxin-antitoxin system Y4mF family antitoxin [Lysobacter auxotrophicus]|uniref:type II toxin-antitoxin system Y4mF family antitoxin n=1 Tax=Lysobacter auxotrophicus TaxID=2992573 RepID=UPI003CCCDD0C